MRARRRERHRWGDPSPHGATLRVHRLELTGQLGHHSAVALEAAIDELCAAGVERLVIDLGRLEAIDRTGAAVLAMRCGLCGRRGVTVELVGGRPEVLRVFETAGFRAQLPFAEDENPLVRA